MATGLAGLVIHHSRPVRGPGPVVSAWSILSAIKQAKLSSRLFDEARSCLSSPDAYSETKKRGQVSCRMDDPDYFDAVINGPVKNCVVAHCEAPEAGSQIFA
jgi:hypothetical protein